MAGWLPYGYLTTAGKRHERLQLNVTSTHLTIGDSRIILLYLHTHVGDAVIEHPKMASFPYFPYLPYYHVVAI